MFRHVKANKPMEINIAYGVTTRTRNGTTMYRLGNDATLYNMAKHGVKTVYKNNWNETKILPTQIQHELLISWLRCEETIPESDEDLERIVQTMENGWESMKPIGPIMFLNLMRLPDEVPPFAYERNHIIWDYYVWKKGDVQSKICGGCMGSKGQFYKPWSANMWLEKGWTFTMIQDHSMIDGDKLLKDLIWNEDNWCSECIIEPLWEHILDDDDCLDTYDFHLRRRRRWSSSSSEDSDIDYRREINVLGNRMSPTLYSICKENK